MGPFLAVTLILALGLPQLVLLAHDAGWVSRVPSFLYESTWLVAFVTSVIFVYLFRWRKPASFVQLYLLSMVIKLLACFAYTLLMILDDRSKAVPNATYFLAVYFIFTVVEIGFLYRKISRSPRS